MVSEATPCVGGARQGVPVRTRHVGICRQRKGVVTEATPYLNGGKATDLETRHYLGGETLRVSISRPYMNICRHRNSGVRSHVMCGRSKTGSSSINAINGNMCTEKESAVRSDALCGRGKTGSSSKNMTYEYMQAEK